jgi:hypothetical protein
MKPNDMALNPHVEMPAWLRALQQAVSDIEFVVPGTTLGPLSALDELISLEGFAGAETSADRSSLQRDLGAALGALGPEMIEASSPAFAVAPWRAFRSSCEIGRAPRSLPPPHKCYERS